MTPAERRGVELSRVRFRRAITLVLMTLVLPGSAQLVAGRKEVGRLAIRVVLGCLGVLALVVLLGLVWHGFVFWLMSSTFMLGFFRLLLCALAIGWALLFIDAWRLGQPLDLAQKQRLWMVGINSTLMFSVVGVLLYGSHLVAVQRDFIIAMFGDGEVTGAHDGRYNVLLLGGDSGADRWGMRPDSITVASIDAKTGETILFGLPRNMTSFPFPKGSVMEEQFPDGYDDELNSLATFAQDNKSLFKGMGDPGVAATMQGVEGITGLKINYYAMVNLDGFRNFVSAMGGLTLNVREPIPVGRIGKIEGYVQPGVRKLNGFETLWYARSRAAADDYSRMARQKCVMNAMLQQLSPGKVITKFEALTKATQGLLQTNLPASQLGKFAELSMKARSQPVRTVSFVPPAINTGHPDIAKIRDMIKTAVDGKTKAAPKKSAPKGFTRDHASTSGASKGNIHDGYAANEAQDLTNAC
jgi:polyisoprenyl-teichoic acid--peptidoglycan teichoic acid transferase